MLTVPRAVRCALLLSSLSAGAACAGFAVADEPRPPVRSAEAGQTSAVPPSLPELSVEAQRIVVQRQVSAFVRGLTRNPGHADSSLVRWNAPVCPFVAGLSPPENERLVARVAAVIRASGARSGPPGCHPNLVVVVTAQPAQVLRAWSARDGHLFGRAGLLEVRHFLQQSQARPVSTWYNIDSSPARGRAFLAHRMENQQSVPVSAQAEPSHLAWNAVLSISSAFEIIDAVRAAHASADQLADYAAMVALTNVDPRADLGSAPSILKLFGTSAEAVPPALSAWDVAFLKALYQSDQASRVQRSQIVDRVLGELAR